MTEARMVDIEQSVNGHEHSYLLWMFMAMVPDRKREKTLSVKLI